ncbi:MAG TPA: XRE family transcriptional regulator [Lachnospiraceae bacterium]|nr:XRE family transcriptional regulator [Lachnospiraceae bacterium]
MYDMFERLLKEKGVTAYKVGKETGITPSTFTHWKNGEYEPKLDKLQKISDYFGVTVEYLMTGEEKNCDNVSGTDEFTAKNEEEKELLVLCRQTEDMPPEYKEKMYNTIKDTIDIYLKAIGKGE